VGPTLCHSFSGGNLDLFGRTKRLREDSPAMVSATSCSSCVHVRRACSTRHVTRVQAAVQVCHAPASGLNGVRGFGDSGVRVRSLARKPPYIAYTKAPPPRATNFVARDHIYLASWDIFLKLASMILRIGWYFSRVWRDLGVRRFSLA